MDICYNNRAVREFYYAGGKNEQFYGFKKRGKDVPVSRC